MIEIFDNKEIILNISKYLIEPSILIIDHYYTTDNKLKIITDKDFTNSQIDTYLIYINSQITNKLQLLDSFDLFVTIITDINYQEFTYYQTSIKTKKKLHFNNNI